MAKLMYNLTGVRGRYMRLYDTKCVIVTQKTVGSLLTGNFTDGEKTIFLCDVVGVQFKESGATIGYLQFETPSMQMNNASSNTFSENTFTFEDGKSGVTNKLMREVYGYVVTRLEEIKYGAVSVPTQTAPAPQEEKTPEPENNVPNQIADGFWVCGRCNTKNLSTRQDCWSCGNKRD